VIELANSCMLIHVCVYRMAFFVIIWLLAGCFFWWNAEVSAFLQAASDDVYSDLAFYGLEW
jgi:hypothetical protein